jgi:hypothetical protein
MPPAKPLHFGLDLGAQLVTSHFVQPELDEMPRRVDARLGQVTGARLVGPLRVAEGQLDGRVAIGVGPLYLRDPTGPGLDHGDGHGPPRFVEDLGHPDLATEDPFRLCCH